MKEKKERQEGKEKKKEKEKKRKCEWMQNNTVYLNKKVKS